MASIDIRAVHKRFGAATVLSGVDLQIVAGDFVVILGPSGCGKSTLLRLVAGLETITSGEIAIDGRVVNALEPRERGCAMVFQNYALYPHMSVADNIGYALKVAGVGKAERMRRIEEVAQTLGLSPYLTRKPSALSGGQRQRVAMGRAMIREPRVFLFDEPLSNLDAQLRVQLRAEIRRLHKRLGVTSIFVTHDQMEAMTLADTLVVMNGGKIEQIGTPSAVYETPASRFVAAFIGSPPMNLAEGIVDADGAFRADVAAWSGLAPHAGTALAGRRAIVGLRPEKAVVLSEPAAGALPATVEFTEEYGAGRVVHLDLGGKTFAAATQASAPPVGASVWLSVQHADAHLFDAESGLRVAPSGGAA